jgi:hypothetical protein
MKTKEEASDAAEPLPEFAVGECATIKTNDEDAILNGVCVTIKTATLDAAEQKFRYTCECADLGNPGMSVSVMAEDLVKAVHKVGNGVEFLNNFRPPKRTRPWKSGMPLQRSVPQATYERCWGTVIAVYIQKGKLKYTIDMGKAEVFQKHVEDEDGCLGTGYTSSDYSTEDETENQAPNGDNGSSAEC